VRAVRFERNGGPEVLERTQAPDPEHLESRGTTGKLLLLRDDRAMRVDLLGERAGAGQAARRPEHPT
jgi:hypothetical protein